MSLDTAIHIISERMLVTFDLPNKPLCTLPPEECITLARSIIATANTSADIFTRVVVMRSIVYEVEETDQHDITVWTHPGPITAAKFLELMQYPKGISHDAWRAYMASIVNIPSTLRKIASQRDLLQVPEQGARPRVGSFPKMAEDSLTKMAPTDGKSSGT